MSFYNVAYGKHIIVMKEANIAPYDDVAAMLSENLDMPRYNKTVFVLTFSDVMSGPCPLADHLRAKFEGHKIICYQLEQLVPECAPWLNVERLANNLKQFDEVWDYDQKNSDVLALHGIIVSKVLPMLYTESLNKIPINKNPVIDVLFYGTISPRRFNILQEIIKAGNFSLKTCVVSGIFGDDLDKIMSESKIVLNIHVFEENRQEQVRMFYPLNNAKAVLSETSIINYMGTCIKESKDTTGIIEEIKNLIKDKNWIDFGKQARDQFKKISKDRLEELK